MSAPTDLATIHAASPDQLRAWAAENEAELRAADWGEAQRRLLTHCGMFGSEGWPIVKLRRCWMWDTDAVKGPPTVFRTKREAMESFRTYLDILIERSGLESQARALRELAERKLQATGGAQ